MPEQKNILLGHGSGGKLSNELIENIFIKHFSNQILAQQGDSALLDIPSNLISFTTDSFVVDPLFFKGGNIGKLAIAGTVNDLAVSGAKPLYLSVGFIIEEGLNIEVLESVVETMAEEAKKAGVSIVTGDTKVVDRGKCDKLFINTTGIGVLDKDLKNISNASNISVGDKIIINGGIAEHGMAIMAERNDLNISADIKSDCASLNHLIAELVDKFGAKIKFMRDATRGGISTVLSELVKNKNFGIEVHEKKVPLKENVSGMCELLGFDPFYVANEGKVIIVIDRDSADEALSIIRKNEFGKDAAIIGEITKENPGKGRIITSIGGSRVIDMLSGQQLPRIC
jgi:hydrogenase expression/formation protein HypE